MAIQRDDPEQRQADQQAAIFTPLAAKAARGERLSAYEQGALQAVAVGRGPRDIAQQASTLLQGYQQRRGTTGGSGLTEQQVKRAIQQGLEEPMRELLDIVAERMAGED